MHSHSMQAGLQPPLVSSLAVRFSGRGGGYEPRLRHMQLNMLNSSCNIYDKTYSNYKFILQSVKRKIDSAIRL